MNRSGEGGGDPAMLTPASQVRLGGRRDKRKATIMNGEKNQKQIVQDTWYLVCSLVATGDISGDRAKVGKNPHRRHHHHHHHRRRLRYHLDHPHHRHHPHHRDRHHLHHYRRHHHIIISSSSSSLSLLIARQDYVTKAAGNTHEDTPTMLHL